MGIIFPFQGSTPTGSPSLSKNNLQNPLPECPHSPNCTRLSVEFDQPDHTLYSTVKDVFEQIGPHEITLIETDLTIEAVFRIPIFGFKDDVKILIVPGGEKSVLHIRSASRVGHSDLGVNRRRVQRIIRNIKNNLN